MRKLVCASLLILAFAEPAFCWEARYKQKAELWIVNGVVTKSAPHAYVTLDIQDDVVLYKEIEDWKYKTSSRPGGVFQIVSRGRPFQMQSHEETQNVIRAFRSGGESVNFLIIGETFLLEVKNSVIVGNAVTYQYYERVPD